jgi:hypothetical protein
MLSTFVADSRLAETQLEPDRNIAASRYTGPRDTRCVPTYGSLTLSYMPWRACPQVADERVATTAWCKANLVRVRAFLPVGKVRVDLDDVQLRVGCTSQTASQRQGGAGVASIAGAAEIGGTPAVSTNGDHGDRRGRIVGNESERAICTGVASVSQAWNGCHDVCVRCSMGICPPGLNSKCAGLPSASTLLNSSSGGAPL